MSETLQDRVAKLIPSASLKNAIEKNGYHFTDIGLLKTVFFCAPDFDTRLDYLQQLESFFSGELKAYTARIMHTQRQMLDAFLRNESGAVYELHIRETPDAYDETYLCSSFEAAMEMIPLFYREYDCGETPSSRYQIVKRRVFSASAGQAFSEDYLGEAVIFPGGVLYSVEMEGFRAEDCDGHCLDCDRCCLQNYVVPYPCFTSNGDAVRFQKSDGAEGFGIVLQQDSAPSGDCYIIPLDSEAIRYHDFANLHNAHIHIPSPFVEVISAGCLPEKMREDYLACLADLNDKR